MAHVKKFMILGREGDAADRRRSVDASDHAAITPRYHGWPIPKQSVICTSVNPMEGSVEPKARGLLQPKLTHSDQEKILW
jgi:hypothetical protein